MRFATILLVASCTPSAPATPSFQEDVLPILAANCTRCHGYPRLAGPADMRLDSYIDTAGVLGAASYARAVVERVRDEARPMPPRFPLEDYQVETLAVWVGDLPLGEPPPRGEPRPGNAPPAARVDLLGQDGEVVALAYELRDPDGDPVGAELRATTAEGEVAIAPLHSGRDELRWDTTGLSGEATFHIVADDGAATVRLDVPARLDLGTP